MAERPKNFTGMFKRGKGARSAEPTAEKDIVKELDARAGRFQNPLVGLDFSSDEEDYVPSRPSFARATSDLAVSSNMREPKKASPLLTMKRMSLSDTDISTIGRSGGKRIDISKVDLPPAAAFWFSQDMMKTNDPFGKETPSRPSAEVSKKTVEETKANQLKGELEHVHSIIKRLEEQLHEVVWQYEEAQDENPDLEKQARMLRDDIRTWELKQWKLLERVEKTSGPEKEAKSEIREQDAEGNDMKVITILEGKKQVSAATMDVLVFLLVDETNSDLSYVDYFLLAYRIYMTPQELLQRLIKVFQSIENKDAAIFRVLVVLKKWVERCWKIDFEFEGLQEPFHEFFGTLVPHLKKIGKEFGEFDLVSISKFHALEEFGRPKKSSLSAKTKESMLNRLIHTDKELTFLKATSSVETIAMVLAARERELYASIRPEELFEKLIYKGEGPNPKTPNLLALINWVNQLGFWMGHEICLNYDLKSRTKILARFIQIARACTQLNCWNSVFALVTGLSSSSILRLKKTWAGLSQKKCQLFQELEAICSPEYNYRAYRAIEAKAKIPFIPFFGLHMKDLVFMNDGKPSSLSKGLMSFSKLRSMAVTVKNLLQYQKTTFYEFPQKAGMDDYLDHIAHMKALEERHLFKMSCLCEPSAWKRKSFFVMSKDRTDM